MQKLRDKADLHLHSVYSDGLFTPQEIVKLANSKGISIISIVDHDSIQGLEETEAAASAFGIEVISGVELSSSMNQKEVHILGYFIDRKNTKLNDYLQYFRDERKKRAEKIIKNLNDLNIPLSMESVVSKDFVGSIGRPHIAHALLVNGFVVNYDEAFEKYIGLNGPAYEEKIHFSPKDAIELISQAGGLSFLAHPNKTLNENELINLIDMGIDGMEVIHPSHNAERVNYYKGITIQYFLLESGGSDFHGGRKRDDDNFGSYCVTSQVVDNMKRRLFK
jgi:predicted metal-dependent phosphoesterase TrpH